MPGRPLARFALVLLLALVDIARADESAAVLPLSSATELAELLRPIPPHEPGDAAGTFELHPDFALELVAHEPLVASPVAAAFDELGRLYVAEMRDYPFLPKQGEPPLGRVRLLVDRDGDGRFDVSHVFADELLWPTGVAPWKGGVFVAAAPSIYYLRDDDGDGRADTREIIYTGFGTQNEQGSVNNLAFGLDNYFYGASSVNGGQVRAGANSEDSPLIMKGRDFRFEPFSRAFQPISGNSQFGLAFDDWGNRFLCHESDPSDHVVLPQHYLARNPHLPVPRVTNDMAPGVTPIFRASPLEGWRVVRSTRRKTLGERGEKSAGLSHDVIDGAAGPCIYRGQALGEACRGCLFVGDAQNNLVHRRRHVSQGVTFESLRADENTEFLRSTDNWFRPVNAFNAPDGGLYVCDMYRHQIESVHVPLDVWKQIDLTLGRDRGRIWRIVPRGFVQPAAPALRGVSTADLVKILRHPGGWWRDTAQRLLVERQDAAAGEPLRGVLRGAELAPARVQALYALAGIGALQSGDALAGLGDSTAPVREHALRLAEPWLGSHLEIARRAIDLARDDDPRVRMQAAFSLGEMPTNSPCGADAAAALAEIAVRDGADYWARMAVLSSSTEHSSTLAKLLTVNTAFVARGDAHETIAQLALQIGRVDDPHVVEFLDSLADLPGQSVDSAAAGSLVLGLVSGIQARGGNWRAVLESSSEAAREWVRTLLEASRRLVLDEAAPTDCRQRATGLLALGAWPECRELLTAAIDPRQPDWLQRAAIEAIRQLAPAEAPAVLLASWRQYLPPLRAAVLDAVVSRPDWIEALLGAVDAGEVLPQQVSRSQQLALVNHRDATISRRAEALFNDGNSPRREIIDRYSPALAAAGDLERGDKIYVRECAACHRLGERGKTVGPNLALVRNRTPEQLLAHILDPNREVQPAYIQFVVADARGITHTGIVVGDTGSGITLRRENGAEQTILKADIEEFSSTEKSLMPEGFERTISVDEMADLLAFIQGLLYDIGTHPGHTEPDGDGPVDPGRLPPESAGQ